MMKRLVILLATICLLAQMCPALSEALPDFPFGDPFADPFAGDEFEDAFPGFEDAAQHTLEMTLNGQKIVLAFDSSPEYSLIDEGMVQASFYAYSDDSSYLYELFMTFPENAAAGAVITPDFALNSGTDCSVALIISTTESESYYYSGQIGGTVFPDTSSYSIYVDEVYDSADGRTFSGRLSTTLISLDQDPDAPEATLVITDAPFSFTIAEEESSTFPPIDAAPTLDPDMRKC